MKVLTPLREGYKEQISSRANKFERMWMSSCTCFHALQDGGGSSRYSRGLPSSNRNSSNGQVSVIARAVMEQLQEERKDEIAALRADVYSEVKVRRSLLCHR